MIVDRLSVGLYVIIKDNACNGEKAKPRKRVNITYNIIIICKTQKHFEIDILLGPLKIIDSGKQHGKNEKALLRVVIT